jgi:hypothetical protein
MENVGIFNGRLEYFGVLLYFLLPFGNFVVIWYIFPRFGTLYEEKSGNTATKQSFSASCSGQHVKRY